MTETKVDVAVAEPVIAGLLELVDTVAAVAAVAVEVSLAAPFGLQTERVETAAGYTVELFATPDAPAVAGHEFVVES